MKNDKRKDYLDWDETLMLMSMLIAQRSKDPSTQVGACIVDVNNVIVGLGYNGHPRGCHDDKMPWAREGSALEVKYTYVVHAEANAIMNSNNSVKGCRMYVYLFPCNECAKMIIQSGITEVVYMSDKYADVDIFKASRKMMRTAGVKLRQYIPKHELVLQEIVPEKIAKKSSKKITTKK